MLVRYLRTTNVNLLHVNVCILKLGECLKLPATSTSVKVVRRPNELLSKTLLTCIRNDEI
jgi:hypothetical protein